MKITIWKIIPHSQYPCPLILKQSLSCLLGSLPLPFTAYFTVRKVGGADRQRKKEQKSNGKQRRKASTQHRGRARLCGLALAACPCPLRPLLGQSWGPGSSGPAMALAEHPRRPRLGRAAPGSLASPHSPSQQCHLPDETPSESATRFKKRLGHFSAWVFSIHLPWALFCSFHPKN